jgi:hypothetical protein
MEHPSVADHPARMSAIIANDRAGRVRCGRPPCWFVTLHE